MGNSGNASPEFTISKPRATPATTSDKVTAKKASNNLGARQLFPDLEIVPATRFPDPEVDPVDSEALSDDTTAQALCSAKPETGSTSGEGPNERC